MRYIGALLAAGYREEAEALVPHYGKQLLTVEQYLSEAAASGGMRAVGHAITTLPPEVTLSSQIVLPTSYSPRQWEYFVKPPTPTYEEWQAGVRQQYPEDKYRIEWTEEGALIYEKPPTVKERYPVASLAYRQRVEGRVPSVASLVWRQAVEGRVKRPVGYSILERQVEEGRVSQEHLGKTFGLPEEATVTKITSTPTGKQIEYVLPAESVKGPEPFTLPWLSLSLYKTRVAIEKFDPWEAGGKLAEKATGKKFTPEQKEEHRIIGTYATGEYLETKYGVKMGYKSVEEFKYVGLSFTPFAPTPLSPVEYAEAVKKHPGYLIGDIVQYYLLAKAAWSGGKWIYKKVKPPVTKYDVWAKTQQAQLGETPKFLSQEGWEKFYVQMQQPTPIGAFEKPVSTPWRVSTGFPQTPFGVTLEKAIESGKLVPEGAGAGFFLEPELAFQTEEALSKFVLRHVHKPFIPQSFLQPSTSYLTFMGIGVGATQTIKAITYVKTPKLKSSSELKPKIVTKPKKIEILKSKVEQISMVMQVPEATQMSGLSQAQKVTQTQVQRQAQRQVQRMRQLQRVETPSRAMQVPKWLEPPKVKKRKPRKRKGDYLGLYGRYPRFWPLATPKQVLKLATGK